MKNIKYIFFHVPKSGGMWLRSLMERNVSSMLTIDHMTILSYMSDEELRSYDAICGHFGYRLKNRLPEHKTFTFLRHPIRRLQSMHAYWRSMSEDTRNKGISGKPFLDFVLSDDEGVYTEARNGQSWQICVDREPGMRSLHQDTSMDTVLEIAKDNLLMMDFVGLHEDFENDVKSLCEKFGWSQPGIPPINVTPKENYVNSISRKDYEIIRDYNKYDFELYNFAKKMKSEGYWRK